MDKTGSTSTLAPKTTRRNFFQWAVKWFYANVPEDTSKKSDIPSIICLLQAAGFKLREFEKRSSLSADKDELKSNNIRITMECGSSKMTAVLEMEDVTCECPDNNEAKDGSFWSITGTGPMASMDNVNKFEETGSNLLPEMSKEMTSVVRDVVHRLFKLIGNNCDDVEAADFMANSPARAVNTTITKNADIKEGLVRSYTDLYNHKPRTVAKLSSNLANSKCMSSSKSIKDAGLPEKPKLQRQGTYDLDDNESMEEPRPSPPKLASSPVQLDQLCTSLGQISLQSEDEPLSLADYVVKAHQILDKAMNFIIKKLPNQTSAHDDANFVKPAPPSLMSSSFCSSSPSRPRTHSMIHRSVSNASARSSSSSAASAASGNSRTTTAAVNGRSTTLGQKPALAPRTSGALPPMRDRSSSLSAAQRPQPAVRAALGGQRRSAHSGSTLALTPRPTTAPTKLPASKLAQTRGRASLTLERPVLVAKRLSPDAKNQGSSPAPSSQARGNVSLIKAPSAGSRLNTSVSAKFGYSAAKK